MERAASPAESLLSVASHVPNGNAVAHQHLGASTSRQVATGGRATSSTASAVRRVKAQQADANHHAEGSGSRNELLNAPPSSSAAHPSLPLPFANGTQNKNEVNGTRAASNGVGEWTPGQLEGPGMPVARNFTPATAIPDGNDSAAGQEGDGDPEDTQLYCFCNGVSWGAMIACEDPQCDKEWVSFLRLFGCHVVILKLHSSSSICNVSGSKKPQTVTGYVTHVEPDAQIQNAQEEGGRGELVVAVVVVGTLLHDKTEIHFLSVASFLCMFPFAVRSSLLGSDCYFRSAPKQYLVSLCQLIVLS